MAFDGNHRSSVFRALQGWARSVIGGPTAARRGRIRAVNRSSKQSSRPAASAASGASASGSIGTPERPRLAVFRSSKHIYAQVIDDETGTTLASASTLDGAVKAPATAYGGNKAAAAVVGKVVAERAKQAGIDKVCFDRRSYKYHGRVQALADAAREAGLQF